MSPSIHNPWRVAFWFCGITWRVSNVCTITQIAKKYILLSNANLSKVYVRCTHKLKLKHATFMYCRNSRLGQVRQSNRKGRREIAALARLLGLHIASREWMRRGSAPRDEVATHDSSKGTAEAVYDSQRQIFGAFTWCTCVHNCVSSVSDFWYTRSNVCASAFIFSHRFFRNFSTS